MNIQSTRANESGTAETGSYDPEALVNPKLDPTSC